jgi:hypothetical protein
MKTLIAILIALVIMILGTAFTAYTTWQQALGDGRFLWTELNPIIIWSEAVLFSLAIPVGLYLMAKMLGWRNGD